MRQSIKNLCKEARACQGYDNEILFRLDDNISRLGPFGVGEISMNRAKYFRARMEADAANSRGDSDAYSRFLAEVGASDKAYRENIEELEALQKERERMKVFHDEIGKPKPITCPLTGDVCGGVR
ncbi:MAG: hypothetical protein A2W19_11755 [Spirochaetes bacterium RBG_16_49_21]|nr:MAG: hypothetical protein A2W19_11755 [Spirochaetes bacterium RBG_16_49_21]